MNPSPTMLAIVTDAFGGRGGIAQYNRDFLGALAETGAASSITVLPRPISSCCRKGSNKHRLGPVGLVTRSRPCERPSSGPSISYSVDTSLWRRWQC